MKSFLKWIEATAETEGSPALSEPQDKKGENNMDLAKIVENRIKAILQELGPDQKNKGTQDEILSAIADYVGKMGGNNQQQAPQGSQQQVPPPQGNQQQPQEMEMNPVAQGNNPGNF